jgi:hypothetical protein
MKSLVVQSPRGVGRRRAYSEDEVRPIEKDLLSDLLVPTQGKKSPFCMLIMVGMRGTFLS